MFLVPNPFAAIMDGPSTSAAALKEEIARLTGKYASRREHANQASPPDEEHRADVLSRSDQPPQDFGISTSAADSISSINQASEQRIREPELQASQQAYKHRK